MTDFKWKRVSSTGRAWTRWLVGGAVLCLGNLAFGEQDRTRTSTANDLPVTRDVTHPLVRASLERTTHHVHYDGRYIAISYPGGDVPDSIGVCTDVVIRSYRALGVDLQKRVHEDMKENFSEYPTHWGLSRPDRNIDHRRVPNLRRFFERHGESITVTQNGSDYRPGDLVTWMLPGNLPHIGVVSDRVGVSGNPRIVHNIGSGPKLEDRLFDFPITGHYRYSSREVRR